MAKKTSSRFGANVTADVERRKREGSSYGYLKLPQNVNVFKEKEGKLKVDIIPYIVTDENHMDGNPKYPDAANPGNPWYKKPIMVHRSVGAENQSIICPRSQGKKCPICEHRAKQQSQGAEKDDLIAKPQTRVLYVVIPIGNKEYEAKFHIWDISYGNFQKKLDEELGENPEAGIFPDPSEGYTLSVRFSEEVFNKNKYYEASRIDFEEREGYDEKIMEQAPNLDEVVTILTYKEIEKMFLEIDEDEEVEEEAPKKKSTFPAKKVKDEEVEEEAHPFRKKKTVVQEEEEEVETEEEEAPVLKKKAAPETPFKRKPAPKEEEAEEEEEEPEAEEEAPAPRRKTIPAKEEPKKKGGEVSQTCPSGHKFGKDWDGYDSCDDCSVFKACGKAHETSK